MAAATGADDFVAHLRAISGTAWEAAVRHPFLDGVADGTLPLDRFRQYIMADAYYLSVFARAQAAAAACAPSMAEGARMSEHAVATAKAEMELHETIFKDLGISAEEKANFVPAPSVIQYTNHLLAVAAKCDYGQILSAMLPCYWVYADIGERLRGAAPDVAIYAKWIATYGSEWFNELVKEMKNKVEAIAQEATPAQRHDMTRNFCISVHCEVAFWQSAFSGERWIGYVPPVAATQK